MEQESNSAVGELLHEMSHFPDNEEDMGIEEEFLDFSPEELELPVLTFDFEGVEYIAEDDLEMHRPDERDDISVLSLDGTCSPIEEPELIEMDDFLPQHEEEDVAPTEVETEPFNFEALNVTDLKTDISEEDKSREYMEL